MRAVTLVVVFSVLFCGLASMAAVFAEKQLAAAKEASAASAPKPEVAVAEAILEVTPELAKQGEGLYVSYGCIGCHSADGSMRVGPSFMGIYGRSEKLTDGTAVKVDEAYLRESMLDPTRRIVAGYTPTMPTFASRMEKRDQDALIVWMKSLR